MVRQQNKSHEPPLPDESWWAALLLDEESSRRRVIEGHPPRGSVAEQKDPPGNHKPATAEAVIDWERIQQLFDQDETVHLAVTAYNRGGLLVGGESLRGFVPVSHLIEINCQMDDAVREERLAAYVDRTISLKVIECDEDRGRVVYSERAAQAAAGRRNELFCDVRPGDFVFGTVTNITDFGVFVDLGGVEGLVHVSELSWGRVRHPADVVHAGDYLKAYVLHVDKERSRIALSLKRLHPNPWTTVEQRYQPGQIVNVVITSIVPFGAFARVEEGLDGLIHATELSNSAANGELSNGLCEGQSIQARVINVDAARQRLGLSLKLD
jgi:small subunit ribosomal protein S1